MSGWNEEELRRIGDATELQLASVRPDDTLRPCVTMWVVRAGDDLYVRFAYGPDNPWFRRAKASGTGRIRAGGVELPGEELFFAEVHLHGGPAPVRRFLPELIDLIWNRKIDPGKVFDLELPLEEVAEGYRAMDERRAIKTLLRP